MSTSFQFDILKFELICKIICYFSLSVLFFNEDKFLLLINELIMFSHEFLRLFIMKIRYAVEYYIRNEEKSIEEKVNVMRK